MSDARRRDLERLAEEGDLGARVRLLRERIREGSLRPWRVELAAYAGDEAAFDALDPGSRAALVAHEWKTFDSERILDARAVFGGFVSLGEDAPKRAAVSAVRAALKAGPRLGRPERERLAIALETRSGPPCLEKARVGSDVWPFVGRRALEAAGALIERQDFEAAFLGAMEAAFEAVVEKLRHDFAEGMAARDKSLAAVLGSPEARTAVRARLGTLSAWVAGLNRWGSLVVARALATAWTRSPFDTAAAGKEAVDRWLASPTLENAAEVTASHRGTAVVLAVRLATQESGVPAPPSPSILGPAMAPTLARVAQAGGMAPVQESIREFALGRSPLFLYERLAVEEDLGSSRLGSLLAVRDTESGRSQQAFALHDPLAFDSVREITKPLEGLDHPNLARLVRVANPTRASVLLVFEGAAGRSLADWAREKPPREDRLAVLRDVLVGLEHAHAKGVFHGYLGPTSVRLEGGTARVTDLGHERLARLAELDRTFVDSVGVHGLLCPEKIMEIGRPATAAMDVYGVAALAFWLFEGRPPYENPVLLELAYAILRRTPPRCGFKPDVIAKALAKDPHERFASLGELREALLGEAV